MIALDVLHSILGSVCGNKTCLIQGYYNLEV